MEIKKIHIYLNGDGEEKPIKKRETNTYIKKRENEWGAAKELAREQEKDVK